MSSKSPENAAVFSAPRGFATSLGFRVSLWNVAAVLATGFVTMILLRWSVIRVLTNEADELLVAEADQLAGRWLDEDRFRSNEWRRDLEQMVADESNLGLFLRLFGDDGQLIWSSNEAPDVARLGTTGSNRASDVGTWRIVERPVGDGSILQAGISRTLTVDRQISAIDREMLVAVGFVSLIAPAFGYFLARRVTQPLRSMIDQTSRMRPSDVSNRVRVGGTGDELDQLATVVNGLLDRIADYLSKHRDFVANAAHDLRTPLAAIRTSLEVALNAPPSPEEREELLYRVADECHGLETLVNQLLLLAETDAGRLESLRTPVRLDDLVRKTADMFGPVAESMGVTLTAAPLDVCSTLGSAYHLRQTLNNLVDNAIKYASATTEQARPALIAISLQKDVAAGQAVLSVRDTGPGIAPEHVPLVFDRFFRGDEARTRTGDGRGTGLGLSICQGIVEAHQGTIVCESQLGRGSQFIVRLPLVEHGAEMIAAP